MIARFKILSGEPVCGSEDAMGDACLAESGLASMSVRKTAAWALIEGNSPRT